MYNLNLKKCWDTLLNMNKPDHLTFDSNENSTKTIYLMLSHQLRWFFKKYLLISNLNFTSSDGEMFVKYDKQQDHQKMCGHKGQRQNQTQNARDFQKAQVSLNSQPT